MYSYYSFLCTHSHTYRKAGWKVWITDEMRWEKSGLLELTFVEDNMLVATFLAAGSSVVSEFVGVEDLLNHM